LAPEAGWRCSLAQWRMSHLVVDELLVFAHAERGAVVDREVVDDLHEQRGRAVECLRLFFGLDHLDSFVRAGHLDLVAVVLGVHRELDLGLVELAA
jgi:hypothetical protein